MDDTMSAGDNQPENQEASLGDRPGVSRYLVPNLDRALSILEYLAEHPAGVGLSDIVRALSIPKNSVFRIAVTLQARGYLVRDNDSQRFRLGRKILSLGYAAVDEHSLAERARDSMRLLRDETAETALFGTIVGAQGVVLEQVVSSLPVKVVVDVGTRFPLHSSAPGKVILAHLPDAEREAIIRQMRFTKFNERTITDRRQFAGHLAQVKSQGYAVDEGEENEGISCVAAPVFDHRGKVVAAVWISAPSSRLSTSDLSVITPRVVAAAAEISIRAGYDSNAGYSNS